MLDPEPHTRAGGQPTAAFVRRSTCITCGSNGLRPLASGRYTDEPVRGFIDGDPWGRNPLPFLEGASWELVRCSECGQVEHARILDEEWSARWFDELIGGDAIREFERRTQGGGFAGRWRGWRDRAEHLVAIERLTRRIRGGEAPRLIDFGCGWGAFVQEALAAGWHAVGIDRDASRRAASAAILPDLATLDRQDPGPWHAVTLFEVLEHLPDPLGVLAGLRQRAAPGAVLVLETPDASGVTGIRTIHDYRTLQPLEHLNGFTPATLRAIARRAGWRPIPSPMVFMTSEPWRVLRRAVRGLVRRLRPTVSAYCVAA